MKRGQSQRAARPAPRVTRYPFGIMEQIFFDVLCFVDNFPFVCPSRISTKQAASAVYPMDQGIRAKRCNVFNIETRCARPIYAATSSLAVRDLSATIIPKFDADSRAGAFGTLRKGWSHCRDLFTYYAWLGQACDQEFLAGFTMAAKFS